MLSFCCQHTDGAADGVNNDIVTVFQRLLRGVSGAAKSGAKQIGGTRAGARHHFGLLQAFFTRGFGEFGATCSFVCGLGLITRGGDDRTYILSENFPEIIIRHGFDLCAGAAPARAATTA